MYYFQPRQSSTIHPDWRERKETFKLHPVLDLRHEILLTIKDYRTGWDTAHEVIGTCSVPLSFLEDQCSHAFWLQLRQPGNVL